MSIQIEKILNKCETGTTMHTEYVNSKTPLEVKCPNGHIRKITPSNLLSRGSGAHCKECAGEVSGKKTTAKFLEELKGLGFSGSLGSEYRTAKDSITIVYPCSHEVKRIPSNMLSRPNELSCPICTPKTHGVAPLSKEVVQSSIQEHFPYLTLLEYSKTQVPYTVLDSRCSHISEVHHSNIVHKRVYKCQVCNPKISNQEREVLEYIQGIYSGWVEVNDRSILGGKELDIVIPDLGIAIEYNGAYWHSDIKVHKNYHLDKTNCVESIGFKLIHIDEYDWLNKKDIVKSRLASAIGYSLYKVYAKDCTLEKISFPKGFLELNHLQGAGAPTATNYALVHNGEVVSVMTFGRTRFEKNLDVELIRFCSKVSTSVVGAASKLLGAWVSEHKGANLVTYADRAYSTGNLYEKLGFVKTGVTDPGYYYINSSMHKLSRHQCTKEKLKEMFPEYYISELSEQDIMTLAKYYRVYNSGSIKYLLQTV